VSKVHEESAPPRGTTDSLNLRTGGRIGSLRKEGEMKGRGIKVFGVVMALLLVFSFAATFSVSSTSVVSAGTQKWTQIAIPDTDDMQLAPNTDIGAIAVSPDGATLFAAVYNEIGVNWDVYKSVDGGHTWKITGLTSAFLASQPDATDIIDIKISPAWEDDDIIIVATALDVYISDDRAKTWTSMTAGTGFATAVTCIDIALDNDGDATYVVGTGTAGGDVFILSGFSGWVPQYVYTGYPVFTGVLSVAFSPNYGEDGVVYAIINGRSLTDLTATPPIAAGTHFRGESDIEVNNWGSYIQDAHFMDESDGAPILAGMACLAFADDYNSQPAVFVGLDSGAPPAMRGDAFRVDVVTGTIATSAVDDLNIRGPETRTNVVDIAVSGDASSAFIYVALHYLSFNGPMSTWQGDVHYSANGGETWLQCYKPPSGMTIPNSTCMPRLVLAPDYADSGIAYCSNGYESGLTHSFSGFYATTKDLNDSTCWNGRGLLEIVISQILDIEVSPDYDADSTLCMVTRDNLMDGLYPFGFLWETKDGGSTWELICGMTLAIPLPGVSINKVAIPAQYPTEPSIFVTGPTDAGGAASAQIALSTDLGNLWATTLLAPYDSAHNPLPVGTWVVIDNQTLIVSNADKVFKTTDMGAHWTGTDDSEIAIGETIVDMDIFDDTTVIVGTDRGSVYMCQNWDTDFSFTQVDVGRPGIAGDDVYVAFDTNFDENGMIYAGIDGALATCGIWRIDANSGDEWEQIWDSEDIYSIATDGNGILWALTDDGTQSVGLRQVNPTDPIDNILPTGDSPFELIGDDPAEGLGSSELWTDLETAPTQTYVFAIGGAGNLELWAYIDTLIGPTLVSPPCGTTAAGTIIQGSALARVSLMWEDMPKATEYWYEVAYDDEFGSIAASGNLSGTQVSVNLYLGELFYWRMRSLEPVVSQWSEVCSFTTPLGPASAKPVITYPGSTDSHNDIELTPSLTWTSTVEATGFELVLAANCDWSNPIVNLTGSSALVGPDTCYAITQALQQGTNYCWKVRAVNSDTDTMSPWSDTGTFTTLVVPVEEEEGTPMWVWVVIALSAVLLVGVVVLIIRTRRPV